MSSFCGVGPALSGKHQHLSKRGASSTLSNTLLHLLDPICVSQSVKRMLAAGRAWRHISNHYGLAIPHERILEHLCQLATAERSVIFALVESADAFLERKKRLVNLSTVDASLLVFLLRVGTTLATS